MKTAQEQHNWSVFLKLFSLQNQMRPTRLGVFEGAPGALVDYWIEDGLPLAGIDVDTRVGALPTIQIMLGSDELRQMTHTISNARQMRLLLSADATADGLEIENAEGSTTILRFENDL